MPNYKMIFAGLFILIFIVIFPIFDSGYMRPNEESKTHLEPPISVTTTTMKIHIECCYFPNCPESSENKEPCLCYYAKECDPEDLVIQTTTTTIPILMRGLSEEKVQKIIDEYLIQQQRGSATFKPQEHTIPSDIPGRWFINRSVTFDRKSVSGIMFQMFEVDENDIKYLVDPDYSHEKVANVWLLHWNGSFEDKTEKYI